VSFKMCQIHFWPGFYPCPRWGAHNPLIGWEEIHCPHFHPTRRLWRLVPRPKLLCSAILITGLGPASPSPSRGGACKDRKTSLNYHKYVYKKQSVKGQYRARAAAREIWRDARQTCARAGRYMLGPGRKMNLPGRSRPNLPKDTFGVRNFQILKLAQHTHFSLNRRPSDLFHISSFHRLTVRPVHRSGARQIRGFRSRRTGKTVLDDCGNIDNREWQ